MSSQQQGRRTVNSIERLISRCGVFSVAAALSFATLPPAAFAGDYRYYVTGTQYFAPENGTLPVRPLPTPRPQAVRPLVLMGGGPDVDAAFRWMIQQAGICKPDSSGGACVPTGAGGRFVVIATTGKDEYDPYFFYSDAHDSTSIPAVDGFVGGAHLGLTSAETIVITDRDDADDPFVNEVVGTANALWITGGDQGKYVALWKGTALEKTIATLVRNNIPVGGTSAGASIFGQFIFSAMNGTVTSAQVLSDPYNRYMTFDPTPLSGASFLHIPELRDTFIDPHFDSRNRMGRLVAFVSRSIAPGSGDTGCQGGVLETPQSARGIGIDIETALEISKDPDSGDYMAHRVTNGSSSEDRAVHFVTPQTPPATCAVGAPLSMSDVQVQRLADSKVAFDITRWQTGGSGGGHVSRYTVDEKAGVQTPATIPY